MVKKLIIIFSSIFLLSGCFARMELRPQTNPEEIWVCKEIEDTYFYWDEDSDYFIGIISYDENSKEFVLRENSGLVVEFLPSSVKESGYTSMDDSFLRGRADYQKNIMPVEIIEDKLNILKGEIDTLTFTPQNKKEYFENKETN